METGKTVEQQAVEHVSDAHSVLQSLRREMNQHPGLEDAIAKLELALSLLTTKTGGLL